MIKEVLSIRKFKAGYEVREELIDGLEYGGEDIIMKSAYTPSGDYIGKSRTAYRLCVKRGIKPEKRTTKSNVCSIGFSKKEQKWYGWSHRAIYGFGIGNRVKRGDCAYRPGLATEIVDDLIADGVDNDDILILSGKVKIKQEMCNVEPVNPDEPGGNLRKSNIPAPPEYYYIEVGRGEWTAKTLEDAKQMACDFAEGVS